MRVWILLIALIATPLWCQPTTPGETPGEEAEDPPVTDKAEKEAEKEPMFRWRVGATLGISHGSLLTDPKFNDTMPDEGFVGEFALHARVSAPKVGVSANMRICWGCHELELEEANFQWNPWPWMQVKAGRMSVNAGSYNSRHDFGVRRTITKPLTRIMGNMPRQTEFNHGVLPAPYVDNGASLQFSYNSALIGIQTEWFILTGLKGTGNDIDFVRSRQFRDTNGEPSLGGRLGVDLPFVSLNFSYLWGNYDPNSRRSYQVVSADARIRAGPITLEGEFAFRETEYTDPDSKGGENEFYKYGWWAQLTWNILEPLFVTAMVDTLYVKNMFLATFGPTPVESLAIAGTDDNHRIVRIVGGVGYTPWGGIMVRVNAEYWEFSDFHDAWVIQFGLGWAF
jgi:hypothetical protein